MSNTVRARALRRGAELLGGRQELRKYLKVSAMCLTVWMAGVEPAPTDVFLKVVDLIVERDVLEELRPKDAADRKQIEGK